MSITFTLNGTTTLDESAFLQNPTATPSPAGDADDPWRQSGSDSLQRDTDGIRARL